MEQRTVHCLTALKHTSSAAHPLPQILAKPQARSQSLNLQCRASIHPRGKAPRARPRTPGRGSPPGPRFLSYVNGPARERDRLRELLRARWARQALAQGRRKLAFGRAEILRTLGRGESKVGPLRGTFLRANPKVTSRPRPHSEAGPGDTRPSWGRAMRAPGRASVPAASVPGRGRGGRSSSARFPAPSRAGSPKSTSAGPRDNWGRGPRASFPRMEPHAATEPPPPGTIVHHVFSPELGRRRGVLPRGRSSP